MIELTMRVEWYNEDFSDPEAVSGSSTKLNFVLKSLIWALFHAHSPEGALHMKKAPI